MNFQQNSGGSGQQLRLTPFELACLMDLEEQSSSERSPGSPQANSNASEESFTNAAQQSQNQNQNQNNSQLWDSFEGSACAIAKLYRNPNWHGFQQAAANTTQLYKGSIIAYFSVFLAFLPLLHPYFKGQE